MQMTSIVFFAFTAVIILALCANNRLVKNEKTNIELSKWILLAASYLFVVYADIRFAVVLGVLTVVTWFCAAKPQYTKFGVAAALVCLGYFKYTNFFAQSFCKIIGKDDFVALEIILPLGISFYAFSAISYLVDVKRAKQQARSLKDVALYLSFFPKITSGPVQKSRDFFEQADKKRDISWQCVFIGLQIFAFGMFKKLVLADRLSVFVNQVYRTPMAFDSLTVLLAVVAYSFQIYFDFSGYSDMAIGTAKMLDISLPKNFNLPYLSRNVTELWKRWHITLSSWLQEYLYISLGGNRKGRVRTYVNLVVTMVLGGIWHGAQWTYIIWGALHGAALAVHKLWMSKTGSGKKQHSALSNAVCTVATFAFTSLCWVFFRAETADKAMLIIRRIFAFDTGVTQIYFWLFFALAVYLFSVAAAAAKSKGISNSKNTNTCTIQGFYPLLDFNRFWHLVAFFVLCGLILVLAYTGGSPFIYGAY